jgi:hypothetical protein
MATVGVSPRINQRAAGFVIEGTIGALGTRRKRDAKKRGSTTKLSS